MVPVTSLTLHRLVHQLKKHDFRGILLTLDPGETTGWAVYLAAAETIKLVDCGQIKTWPIHDGIVGVQDLLSKFEPNFLVYESYHVYDWKLDQHSFQEVPTIQIIGMIKTLAYLRGLQWHTQNAQTGKGFCTDDKLKNWGLYIPGLRHAMDAVRHGAHFLLFGLPKI